MCHSSILILVITLCKFLSGEFESGHHLAKIFSSFSIISTESVQDILHLSLHTHDVLHQTRQKIDTLDLIK